VAVASLRLQLLDASHSQSPFARQSMLIDWLMRRLTVVEMSWSEFGISEASRTGRQVASEALLPLPGL
jgi:hypothetical protein